jgi:starvation-inducible outer membrane lipoprotein
MMRQTTWYLTLFLSVYLFGCAPVISEEIRGKADVSLTFKEVAQSPDSYEGKFVLWGGEVIQTLPQDDGSTFIEVLEWPLGWRGKPRRTVSFQGKFLVLSKKPADASPYAGKVRITVAGEIQGSMQGEKVKSVSDPTYRYILLLSKEIHIWKEYGYQYSTPYEPQRYDPSYDPHRGAGILRY